METSISKVYEPQKVEDSRYDFWIKGDYFRAEGDPSKETFTIVIPPPNVTGTLHMGHALDNTLQDILIRWKRMQGFDTLWVPGSDHAGIATQIKVEEHLLEEGLSRYDLGREKFLDRVWEWKEEYHKRITNQLKKLGVSCDWSRERFTMDEGCTRAVREVFVSLYEKDLIYRGNYIINWCPRCHTALSDIEVEHEDENGTLTYMKYPYSQGEGYVMVATTRPETMLGDTAVAVHPGDERYRGLIGKNVILPLVNREIPVVADEFVDPEFGSGAVKVTPAHDPNDFMIGLRHNLEQMVVIGDDGKMTDKAGKYQGMDRYHCREEVVKDLESLGLIVKVDHHEHAVGHCQRCTTVIEPLLSKQWFVKMKPLAEPAITAVKEGRTQFVPSRFTKTYLNWVENIRDWCISRQIWWGHRVPAWYCPCGETIVSRTDLDTCPQCGGRELKQDPDVLDTWFSSALWPFSTLGWPDETLDLTHFFPTNVLVTGYDIIYFWVARMIFMSLQFMNQVPFKEVYIHGLVRDGQGRKMSKSLGNGVDPLEVIQDYGADTLRFTLITGQAPGNDQRWRQENVEASRNFANKIWNASRFVLMNLGEGFQAEDIYLDGNLSLADRWILHRYNQTVREITRLMEKYALGDAARELYDFIWRDFCDWYIEMSKIDLYGEEAENQKKSKSMLCFVLEGTLRLLHPFMPFLSEEIWQHMPHQGEALIIASWPQEDPDLNFTEEGQDMSFLMEVIKSIRNLRSEMNIHPRKGCNVVLKPTEAAATRVLLQGKTYIHHLASTEQLIIEPDLEEKPGQALTSVINGVEIYLPLAGLVDLDKEISRLGKEVSRLEKEVSRAAGKLNNQAFISKARAEVVEKEKNKLEDYREKLVTVQARLEEMQKAKIM
ncbi:valine--tRNA ligase [Candidatus Contubernalis alkaliaceticus]|uniref:valine--tRNA ligase n=1 Tax=Candidatus Contubernalis alkaliaceticus TaxID=338645 RepID=UPI001F4C0FF9|nr:valine--tRNA ligase [Candidatus Contubernalis alkalaceticus]UNC90896.1 valine--tRNA ligase [Candidatus Contubernalis alkalaceticus]